MTRRPCQLLCFHHHVPWLIGGTTSIGGNSTAPTNLKSFCGGFINMVFMVSSMLAGACATPEFLMYMNYFIQKEYGKDYWKRADEVVDLSLRKRTMIKLSRTISSRLSIHLTNLQVPVTTRLCSGTSLITTVLTSNHSSETSIPRWFTTRLESSFVVTETLYDLV